jgi:endonuclease-3
MATILSAQCTDKRVNSVTRSLFQRCRSAADYATIPNQELEAIIQSTGFFRAKARSLKACATTLVEKYDGRVPEQMEALTALSGVGRKTANVVLGNAYGRNDGIVVDTHVRRLAQRLGLTHHNSPEKIEAALLPLIPREDWTLFSHWLIWHGRRRCTARNPDCSGCELHSLCPSAPATAKPAQTAAGDHPATDAEGIGTTGSASAS